MGGGLGLIDIKTDNENENVCRVHLFENLFAFVVLFPDFIISGVCLVCALVFVRMFPPSVCVCVCVCVYLLNCT